MKKIEFETLAAANAIDSVAIFEREAESGYQLWVYPRGAYSGKNTLETAKGEARTWASLDVLVRYVKTMGYRGPITLDAWKR